MGLKHLIIPSFSLHTVDVLLGHILMRVGGHVLFADLMPVLGWPSPPQRFRDVGRTNGRRKAICVL